MLFKAASNSCAVFRMYFKIVFFNINKRRAWLLFCVNLKAAFLYSLISEGATVRGLVARSLGENSTLHEFSVLEFTPCIHL